MSLIYIFSAQKIHRVAKTQISPIEWGKFASKIAAKSTAIQSEKNPSECLGFLFRIPQHIRMKRTLCEHTLSEFKYIQ